MKRLLLAAPILLLLIGCKKPARNGDYFIFGVSHSECSGNCARYFMLKKDRLYADKMERGSDKIKFKNEALSADKLTIAKELKDHIPPILKKWSSSTFGCPDCHDQGEYFVEISENSIRRTFKIDPDSAEIPSEIRQFVVHLQAALSKL